MPVNGTTFFITKLVMRLMILAISVWVEILSLLLMLSVSCFQYTRDSQ